MRKLCGALGIVTLILGFLGSAALAYLFGNETKIGKSGNLLEVRSWGTTIEIFIGSFLAFFVLSIILFALAEILDRLEIMDMDK